MAALPTLALFVVSLGYGVVVPLLPQLSGGRVEAAPGVFSVAFAGYAAAKILAQVPGGALADQRGPLALLRGALLAFTVSLAGFLVEGGVAWFTAVRVVEGAATGLVYPAVFALVLRGSGASGRRIGLTVGLGTAGLLVGPALGGALAQVDLRLPVWVALGVAALVTAWAWVASPAGAGPAHARTVAAELAFLGRLARDREFLALGLPIAFNKLTFSAFQGLLPLYGARELGLTTRGVTGLFALTGVVFGVFQAVGGALSDRFAPRALVLALTLPLMGTLVGMALARGAPGFTVAWALYVALSSIIFTATLKAAARAVGTDDTYGGVFGVLGTVTDVMTVVGPVVFLALYAERSALVFPAMAAAGVPFALGYLAWGRISPEAAARLRASGSP